MWHFAFVYATQSDHCTCRRGLIIACLKKCTYRVFRIWRRQSAALVLRLCSTVWAAAPAGVDTGEAVVTGRVWQRGKAEELRKLAARAGRGLGRGGRGRGRVPWRGGRCMACQLVYMPFLAEC